MPQFSVFIRIIFCDSPILAFFFPIGFLEAGIEVATAVFLKVASTPDNGREKKCRFFPIVHSYSKEKNHSKFLLTPHWTQLATFLSPFGEGNEFMGLGLGVCA